MPNASGCPLTRKAEGFCRAAALSVVPLVSDTVSFVRGVGGVIFFLAGSLARLLARVMCCLTAKRPAGLRRGRWHRGSSLFSGSERLAATRCSPARCSGREKKTLRLPPLRLGRGLRAKTHDQPFSQSALFPKMLEQLRWGI